jgi:hypothetical protein
MGTDSYIWDVFASHNQKQKPRVRQMVEQWRQLGLRVFFDEDSINPGADIVASIEDAIKESCHIVLFMSPSAFDSPWVAMETSIALFQDPSAGQGRLIPVLLEQVPPGKIRVAISRLRQVNLIDHERQCQEYHRLLRAMGVSQSTLPNLPDEADKNPDLVVDIPQDRVSSKCDYRSEPLPQGSKSHPPNLSLWTRATGAFALLGFTFLVFFVLFVVARPSPDPPVPPIPIEDIVDVGVDPNSVQAGASAGVRLSIGPSRVSDRDRILRVSSDHPELASPVTNEVVIPAGESEAVVEVKTRWSDNYDRAQIRIDAGESHYSVPLTVCSPQISAFRVAGSSGTPLTKMNGVIGYLVGNHTNVPVEVELEKPAIVDVEIELQCSAKQLSVPRTLTISKGSKSGSVRVQTYDGAYMGWIMASPKYSAPAPPPAPDKRLQLGIFIDPYSPFPPDSLK